MRIKVKMEKKTQLLNMKLLLILDVLITLSAAYLDLEELRNINYGIDIVNEPVTLNAQDPLPENSVQVTSKFGQLYQCSFPNQIEADKKKDEEEKVALETGISELLKPLESEPCLFKTRDWWSYEFCYGKRIRQFHLEDGVVSGSVIMLGYYESDFDWNNDTEDGEGNAKVIDSKSRQRNRLNRYHSQQYVNGSKCDLTGKPRRTEVRFICEEGSGDYIARLDEPETCSYIMTIHTTKICHHPYLKPPIQSKPVPITCHPIISQEEYETYLKEEEEKKLLREKEEEEKRLAKEAEESIALTEGQSEEEADTTPAEPILPYKMKTTDKGRNFEFRDLADINAGEMSKIEKLLQGSLKEELGELSEQFGGQGVDLKMNVKVVKSMDDLHNAIKEAEEEALTLKKSDGKNIGNPDTQGHVQGQKDEGDAEEEKAPKKDTNLKFEKKSFGEKVSDSLDDMDRELDNVNSNLKNDLSEDLDDDKITNVVEEFRRNKKNLASIKESIKKTMKEEFSDIIKEAEEETGIEMTDRKEGYKQLADTLNKLVNKLEKTEKDISDVDEELSKRKSKKDKSILDTLKKKHSDDSSEVEDGLSAEGPPQEKSAISSSSLSSSLSKSSLKSSDSNDRVKVRVTKLKQGGITDQNKQLASTPQTEQLEKEVREGLEKAGLDLGNGKIQVKIITAGYYDDKDESMHILSEEDTSAFKNMIVSILGGDHEASKEQKRQDKMEENYNLVWSNKNKKKPHIP